MQNCEGSTASRSAGVSPAVVGRLGRRPCGNRARRPIAADETSALLLVVGKRLHSTLLCRESSSMRRFVILILAILFAQTALAWNATGHQAMAAIAWDNMTPAARTKAIALLKKAPQ